MTISPRHVIFGTGAIGPAVLDALRRRDETARLVKRPAKWPSSMPGCPTGSDPPVTSPSRSSVCWAGRGNASTSALRGKADA